VVRRYWTTVKAPDLGVAGISFSDSAGGNGDGCMEPGETLDLSLTLTNRGSGGAYGVGVKLSADDPYVTIGVDSAFADSIAPGGLAVLGPAYTLTIAVDCPEFHRIDLRLDVAMAGGRTALDSTSLYVGGSLSDDIESGSPGWAHHGFADLHVDQWHIDTYRNHTPGGGHAWKCGGNGSDPYADFSHAALETPELCLGSSATMVFWHWIHAELNTGKYAWDGGVVEISQDGGKTWSQIAPVGGYYYKIYPNYFSPFAANTPCFAWTNDWTRVEFDLSAYTGSAKIRFRFGSDQYYNSEGWYIDDVAISDEASSVTIPDKDLKVTPVRFALTGIDPNPVSSRFSVAFDVPRTSKVSIEVFDVTGRAMSKLANSTFEPGRYSRSFDCGTGLTPGVYFVSMRAEDFRATKKLIVVR
jgi:hypothetical protein